MKRQDVAIAVMAVFLAGVGVWWLGSGREVEQPGMSEYASRLTTRIEALSSEVEERDREIVVLHERLFHEGEAASGERMRQHATDTALDSCRRTLDGWVSVDALYWRNRHAQAEP